MALGTGTFSLAAGAVSDLLGAESTRDKGKLSAESLRITAAGTRISAESERLTAKSTRLKAAGDLAEAENYDRAAQLARENEIYTAASTRIQQAQKAREATLALGQTRANLGAAGLTEGGSALDILRDSANQGALARGTLAMQGAITEAGYEEQAKSYETLAKTGRATAKGEEEIATSQEGIATQTEGIATKQEGLATETEAAANRAATTQTITGAIKGVAAVASLFTGGTDFGLTEVADNTFGGFSQTGTNAAAVKF